MDSNQSKVSYSGVVYLRYAAPGADVCGSTPMSLLQLLETVDLTGKGEVYLVTANVSSLYTVIQHDDALLALNWALCQRNDIPYNQNVFIRNALDFCLGHNFFWFNGSFYSQCRGVAMGAKFAPSIANLFMGGL